jgi:hypothetical protein
MLCPKSVFSLPSQSFDLFSLALELKLVVVDLPLLRLLDLFVALKLVTDQCPGACAKRGAYERSGHRVSNGAPNDTSRRGPSKGPDPGTFFPRGQRARATKRSDQK